MAVCHLQPKGVVKNPEKSPHNYIHNTLSDHLVSHFEVASESISARIALVIPTTNVVIVRIRLNCAGTDTDAAVIHVTMGALTEPLNLAPLLDDRSR